MKLKEFEAICEKAPPGPWWVNGLDIESSQVIVAEGEDFVQLYDTETEKPTKRIKPHQQRNDDDRIILSCSSILGDREFDEALATAEFIAACREMVPRMIKALKAADKTLVHINNQAPHAMEYWQARAELEQP